MFNRKGTLFTFVVEMNGTSIVISFRKPVYFQCENMKNETTKLESNILFSFE